jgi:very-short-patch-repair endonuclease
MVEENMKRVAWNKGLSKENDLRLSEQGRKISETKKRRYAEGKLVPWDKGIKTGPWSIKRKREHKERMNAPEFKESQRFKAIKYYEEHPEAREARRQESLGVKQTDEAKSKKRIASKRMHRRRTSEEKIAVNKKIGDGNRNKVWTKEFKKFLSDWAKAYFKTPKGIAEQRRRGLITAEKRIERGDFDGIYYNTRIEKEMKAILVKILPKEIEIISQYAVWDIEHGCIVDFYIPVFNLVIEVDGKIVHNYPNGREIDHIRTKELEEAGYRVLRFWEDAFDEESVMESIRDWLIEYEMKLNRKD